MLDHTWYEESTVRWAIPWVGTWHIILARQLLTKLKVAYNVELQQKKTQQMGNKPNYNTIP